MTRVETGDVKKGQATDYVAKQYIGNLGKTENGIVSVNAHTLISELIYPLLFLSWLRVFMGQVGM